MKPINLLLSAAVIAIAAGSVITASAQPGQDRVERRERHRIEMTRIDANNDKFVTRAEAQAEAERVFGELDGNHDGKLDATDRAAHGGHMIRRVEIRTGDGGEHVEDIIEPGDAPGEGKNVIIHREIRKDGDRPHRGGPRPPIPPRPPGPPMFMMIFAHSEEADRNGDGALSKEEFVAQQLRFFDAADANGDGKIKFDPPPMPEPPEPPVPPKPPTPPTPPRP